MGEELLDIGSDGTVSLRAGRCLRCETPQFPRPVSCGSCGGPVDALPLDGHGASLWGWTSVQASPPGYDGPVPYGFGVVELPEGLRIVTRLTEADPTNLRFGQPMHLVVDVVARDDDAREIVTWAFAPDPEARP